jgi:hypothetical protein
MLCLKSGERLCSIDRGRRMGGAGRMLEGCLVMWRNEGLVLGW